MNNAIVKTLLLMMILIAGLYGSAEASREIIDMTGRRVIVPDTIRKVYGTVPPATFMIYAVDPGLIAGLNSPLTAPGGKYLDPRMHKLPVVGGWMGQSKTPNYETLLKLKPDVAVAWLWKGTPLNSKMDKTFESFGIPLVYIKIDSLQDYPNAFRFLGQLLGRNARTRELGTYAQKTLDSLKQLRSMVPDSKKVSVYYAEGPDGLSTECSDSVHAELILLSNGRNIYRCEQQSIYGMEKISMEEIIRQNPEVILAQDKNFAKTVYNDRRWSNIRAVKNHRVYHAPVAPIDWFDRPPTFMRLLGAKWLANQFYPEQYPLDLMVETREFYKLFLNVSLSKQNAMEILAQ